MSGCRGRGLELILSIVWSPLVSQCNIWRQRMTRGGEGGGGGGVALIYGSVLGGATVRPQRLHKPLMILSYRLNVWH